MIEIDVSYRARRYIGDRGGELYVWFQRVGRGEFSVQRVSLVAPLGVEFSGHAAGTINVFLPVGFTPPRPLEIRRWPWPIGPILVTGTGAGELAQWGGGG